MPTARRSRPSDQAGLSLLLLLLVVGPVGYAELPTVGPVCPAAAWSLKHENCFGEKQKCHTSSRLLGLRLSESRVHLYPIQLGRDAMSAQQYMVTATVPSGQMMQVALAPGQPPLTVTVPPGIQPGQQFMIQPQ